MSEEIKPGWSYNKIEDISWCVNKSKIIEVQVYMIYNPPYNNSDYIWKGEVNSGRKTILIKEPQGIDKQAYEEFNKEPLSYPDEL